MDCYYAAIEVRDFHQLVDKPIAVGGEANRRGGIATCNYAARVFWVAELLILFITIQLFSRIVEIF